MSAADGQAVDATTSLGPPTAAERVLYAFVRGVLLGVGRLWFRIRASGLEHVPSEGPYILAPVHRSNLDFLMVLVCSKRRMRYLAKDTLWKPGWARLFDALGGIPVHRGTADREALRTCIAVIEAGEPLVIFPEGTRQQGPTVCDMFDGPAFVQSRTGVPIVPVGIGGSEAAMPKGSKIPKPHRVTVRVGPPLAAPVTDGPKARRSAVRTQTVALKAEIQRLFDQAQIDAGTPNHR
ncbi:MAG: putative acyltransferase [Acidimicrobiales bacterium]|nr:putative acyltransferase [Acidimicrobiales bacterium]